MKWRGWNGQEEGGWQGQGLVKGWEMKGGRNGGERGG